MRKLTKYLVYLIIFFVLLFGGLLLLIYSIDPSILKPTIEKELAKQGVSAQFGGPIRWQFFPNFGISLEQLSLKSETDSAQPLAAVNKVAFSVKVKPLLQRKIQINGIQVDAATLNLIIDQQGRANWQSLIDKDTQQPAEENPAQSAAMELPEINIEQLAITGLSVEYNDMQTNQKISVNNLNLEAQHLNISGQPFPITFSVVANLPELPAIALQLQSQIAVNVNQQTLALDKADGAVELHRNGADKQTLAFNLDSRLNWSDPLAASANVALQSFNLRQLLFLLTATEMTTQNPQAMSKAAAALKLQYGADKIALSDIQLALDSTNLIGNLELTPRELTASQQNYLPWHIVSHWQGDKINVDDYLAPPTETVATAAPTPQPQPLPMETLRMFSSDLKLNFGELMVAEIPISKLALELTTNNGLLKLNNLSANAFSGTIKSTGQLDAQSDTAALKLNLAADAVDIGQLAKHFAELDNFTGNGAAEVNVTSYGKTDVALSDNVKAQALIKSNNLTVAPINLEQQFCKVIAMLEKRELAKIDWAAFTQLQPVTVKADYSNNEVSLTSLNAEIAKLITKANGSLNLDSGKFDFPFDLAIGEFSSGPEGCGSINEKWRKHSLPLRCKGNLNSIDAKVCLPDSERIGAMLKAAADAKIDKTKAELKQKVDAQVDEQKQQAEKEKDKLEDKAKSKLDKELERLRKKSN